MVMKKFLLMGLLLVASVDAGVLGREASFDDVSPAAGPTLVVKESNFGVKQTVKRLEKVLKAKGFTIFSVINHQDNAKKAGLKMKEATVITFGNPKGGTVLMKMDPRMALALPLKIAVYKGRNGVEIVYRNPVSYTQDFLVQGSPVLKKVSAGLDKITDAARK